jgi:hypothetical protein
MHVPQALRLLLPDLFQLDRLVVDKDTLYGISQTRQNTTRPELTLPLYGSGFLQRRIEAAKLPKVVLSIPFNTILVGCGVSTSMSAGISIKTG